MMSTHEPAIEMSLLEQEHLRAVLLDTKNVVIRVVNVYAGNLNTAVVRVGEVFREAVVYYHVSDPRPGWLLQCIRRHACPTRVENSEA